MAQKLDRACGLLQITALNEMYKGEGKEAAAGFGRRTISGGGTWLNEEEGAAPRKTKKNMSKVNCKACGQVGRISCQITSFMGMLIHKDVLRLLLQIALCLMHASLCNPRCITRGVICRWGTTSPTSCVQCTSRPTARQPRCAPMFMTIKHHQVQMYF